MIPMIPDSFNYREIVQEITNGRFLAQEWPDGSAFKTGGESFVFFAKDMRLDMREAAIKIAKPAVRETKRLLVRFFRGAAIQAHLHHMQMAGVPDIYETGEFFYVIEFVRGSPLLDFIKEKCTAAPWPILSRLFRLAHSIHECDIVYRDFKPENILIGKNGEVWLLDYGLAKQREGKNSAITNVGERLGSPLFLTETLSDDAAMANFSDDIQQLGKLLWVCAMGRLPESEMEYNSVVAFADKPFHWSKYYLGSQGGRYKSALAFARELEKDFKIDVSLGTTTPQFVCPHILEIKELLHAAGRSILEEKNG